MRFIMIEDDSTISFAVKKYLEIHNIETDVFNKLEDVEDIDLKNYNLLILDVNLPDGCGFDYLKYIREFSNIPVIMLTVKDSEKNVLNGFSYGADEYITKPFSLPILKARIDNILRRKGNFESKLVFDKLELDVKTKMAKIEDTNLNLNRQEFAVLQYFLENQNINLLREKIIDTVWGYDLYEVNDNTLTVTIKRLRKKLGYYGRYIKTVRGIGYIWKSE